MLKLPNYSDDSMEAKILRAIVSHPQTKYFIVTKFMRLGKTLPTELHQFITDKISTKHSNSTFKTSFSNQDTRLVLTFYSRSEKLNYKFSLIHTFIDMCNSVKVDVKINDVGI